MINFALVGCLLALANGVVGLPQRIIGGHDAPDHKYPYLVSIRQRNPGLPDFHICGGSIISKKFILTAAHCTREILAGADVWVVAGSNYLDKSGDHYKVDKALIHENYIDYFQYDIALLRVKGEIKFHKFVTKVKLPKNNFNDYRAVLEFAGWGNTAPQGAVIVPTQLQEVTLNVITNDVCETYHMSVNERHVCTFNDWRKEGICQGDSGGPLVANGVQIGIASYLRNCMKTGPDVFTRVFSYLNWIEKTIKTNQ